MIAALVFILVIILLVVPHELGHFAAAKWFGIRVDEFGIGFLKRLWARKIGETEYSINILPLGGFVKIYGEEENADDPRSFSGRSFLVKTFVIAAGVLANVFIAYVLYSSLAYIGTPQFSVEIVAVAKGSPAEVAGMRAGDIVEYFGGTDNEMFGIEEVRSYIASKKGETTVFTLLRGSEQLEIIAHPRLLPPEGEGPLGIQIGVRQIGLIRAPLYRAPLEGLKTTMSFLVLLVRGFKEFFASLFTAGIKPDDVAGPVRIAIIARDTLAVGLADFLNILAFLSLNLAVINILPIPALDGGRIFFLVLEKIIRRPIPNRIAGPIHSAFLILLMGFVIWISWREILSLL